MFVSPAYAQTGGGMGGLTSLVPLILIFVIMYFLLIRPQQKKAKEHRAMVEALDRGNQVVTQGGIIGQITKVIDDNQIEVEIDKLNGTRVRVMRNTIAQVLGKGDSTAPKPPRRPAARNTASRQSSKADNES